MVTTIETDIEEEKKSKFYNTCISVGNKNFCFH